MEDNAIQEFFDPLLEDDISKKIIEMLSQNESHDKILDELLKLLENEGK